MNFQEIKETALEISQLPMIFGEEVYDRYCEGVRVYQLNKDQFSRIEWKVSGFELSGDFRDLEGSYQARSLNLAICEETDRNLGFCYAGLVIGEISVTFYYVTTSGTVFSRIVLADATERYFVRIPLKMRFGCHDTIVNLFLRGMTPEQYDRWFGPGGRSGEEYRDFHNSKLCPLGFQKLKEPLARYKSGKSEEVYGFDSGPCDNSDYEVGFDYDDEL